MTEVEWLRDRTLRAADQMRLIGRASPARLGPPDADTGERWGRGNVLGHLAESLPFWTAQLGKVADGQYTIGRGEAGYRERRRAIDAGPSRDETELRAEIDRGIAGIVALLAQLSSSDLGVEVTYVRATEDRRTTVRQLVEELLVYHLETHTEQLRLLS